MQGIPPFVNSGSIVISKTPNGGYAVCENKGDSADKCPVFETWAALIYYLETNFVPSA